MPTVKTDDALQAEVMAELHRSPNVHAAHLGVRALDGAVTLSGEVDSDAERFASVEIAQAVDGVLAVADEVRVRDATSHDRTDTDIAVDVARAFELVPPSVGHMSVDVVDHVVIVTGEVPLRREREALIEAASNVPGVVHVVESLTLGPSPSSDDIRRQIRAAFAAAATAHADAIEVEVVDGRVTLTGGIRSLGERDLAHDAVWTTPGIRSLKDRLHVH